MTYSCLKIPATMSPHVLRHTCATLARDAGDLEDVQHWFPERQLVERLQYATGDRAGTFRFNGLDWTHNPWTTVNLPTPELITYIARY